MPIYNRGKKQDGSFDWDDGGQTFRCLLTTSSYTPNVDHDFVSDVTNELSGGGYARQDVSGRAVVLDDTNDRVDHDATNVSFTIAGSPKYAVIYRFVTVDGDSPLIAYYDLGSVTLTGVLTIKWNGGASSGTVYRGT